MQLSKALASFLESVLALGGPVLCVGSCCDQSKLVCEPQSKWHRQGSLLLPLPPSFGCWAVGAVRPTRKPGLGAQWLPGQSTYWEVGSQAEPSGSTSRTGGGTAEPRGALVRTQGSGSLQKTKVHGTLGRPGERDRGKGEQVEAVSERLEWAAGPSWLRIWA